MNEESVLNVLMYLLQYHMQDDIVLDMKQEQLIEHLQAVGFSHRSIYSALSWLERLGEANQQVITQTIPQAEGIRCFNEYECSLLSVECRNFILSLTAQGILNPITRELVIDRVLELKNEEIDISLIKWVTLVILFSQGENYKEALAKMEFYVLDEPAGGVH